MATKANNIEEYFGTLLQSVTEGHKKHLMTGKYSNHKALNEFYDEMPELVDDLIEHYQGTNGKVENYKNLIEADGKDAVAYLEELLEFTKVGQDEFFKDDKALSSDIDSIVGQISSTLYQLKELREDAGNQNRFHMKSLSEFIKESLASDSQKAKKPRLNTKAWDFNGDEWTIKMIADADSKDIDKLLDEFDQPDSDVPLRSEIEAANPRDLKGLICVGCESTSVKGMKMAFFWGPEGVCYENR